ncbi:D-alanyl-D-alanine carboxypeptidase/D-alanyl-D-alanine-endopeptidase [Arenibacter certesii]|uniref:Peptidase M15 n=1 Tax=Arenibacter certesii TaxID=228955 RepID=A0A918IUC9_9FLAO|nr:D-alanyl-D-alanine carboxypeptidase [Arenibacter certesii]GGW30454.1 peptidase M15 [Arenibacter certesii]
MKYYLKASTLLLLLFLATSCKSLDIKKITSKIDTEIGSDSSEDYFQGVLIYDLKSRDTIYSHNSNKYFTPASNTKIFTLYAALKTLPENIPSLKYIAYKDTLFIEGTGDPTLLHPYFKDSSALKLIKKHNHIALHLNHFKEERFGPGWAWEDYDSYYSPERSGFPLYGNIVDIHMTDSLMVTPKIFQDKVVPIDYIRNREEEKNVFYFDTSRKDTLSVPFKVDTSLTKGLLETVLQQQIKIVAEMPSLIKKTLYSIPSDSVYKRMMLESDNFLAEQLLILSSSTLSDTLNSGTARRYVLEHYLSDLKQAPRWVDGSGLSRYNLFSPESMVAVLTKMVEEFPQDRILHLFPLGGVSGTLEERFPGNPGPYIYAKSGSLGNNYCLSGYLITNSGKTLIFSFMNNHFIKSGAAVRRSMQHIFEHLRDNY